jgi:hypothetical protein
MMALDAPAHADVRQFVDARDDTTSSLDLWSVTVNNSSHSRDKVIVAVREDQILDGDEIVIFFDTRRRDRGPEYLLGGVYGGEYGMSHMEGWRRDGAFISWRCGYRMRTDIAQDRTRAVVPRRCLGAPGRVRVSVKVERGYPATSRDWAPAHETWFPWVRR